MTDMLLSETSEEVKWPAVAWRVSLKENTESSHDHRLDKEIRNWIVTGDSAKNVKKYCKNVITLG